MKQFLYIIVVCFTFSTSFAQEQWSLEKCIKFAIENNIQLKSKKIDVNYSKNQYNQSKYNRLPDLNASLSQGYDSDYSTGFGVNSSITIFDGLRNVNSIKKAKIDLNTQKKDVESYINQISLDVAAYYLQVLLNKELLSVAENQAKVTLQQVERTKILVESGNRAKGFLLQIQAQFAQEELEITNLINSVDLSLINLKQIMNFRSEDVFNVVVPAIKGIASYGAMPEFSEVLSYSYNNLPKVQKALMELESAQKSLKIATGGYLPTLKANASVSTGYNSSLDVGISKQIEGNRKYIGLSLNIPIFNKMNTRTSVKNARLLLLKADNNLDQVKNNIYKEIQTSFQNAEAAKKKYNSTVQTLEYTKEAFRYVKEKFTVGMSYSIEYNESKNKLTKVESDLLQAKYQYIFKRLILDFYNGKQIVL